MAAGGITVLVTHRLANVRRLSGSPLVTPLDVFQTYRDQNERVSALTNPHSPGFARINGVVTNIPEFGQAFSCKANQPMVKAKVCKVW